MKTFKSNLAALWKHLSTHVALIASCAAAYWLQMSPDEQREVLALFPALKWLGPLIAFVAFVLAKGVPQPPKPPKE